MKPTELKLRTKSFSLRVIRMIETLPGSITSDVLSRQLLRSSTSVAANYRSACRARSRADFISKMGIVEEEADESALWLELLEESGLAGRTGLEALRCEASALTAMAVASIRTARSNQANDARPYRRAATGNPQSAIRSSPSG